MQKAEKVALTEISLMRAVEILGDLTEPVMARFYSQHPQAQSVFVHHACGNRARLEAMMIENVLYCIMRWFDQPEEIKIILYSSVPHHTETLKVKADWYEALLAAGVDLIAGTVPAGEAQERALRFAQVVQAAVPTRLTHVRGIAAGVASNPLPMSQVQPVALSYSNLSVPFGFTPGGDQPSPRKKICPVWWRRDTSISPGILVTIPS